MQKEKIAAIALIIIIAGALSFYLISTNQDDIFSNLFPNNGNIDVDGDVIAKGDCIDIHYIGRYASNNTVFDTSYEFIDNKTGGTPLKIFVSSDEETTPPSEYSQYSSSIIEGLMEQLEGLELGETYILDPIPPEKAYGYIFDVGDTIDSTVFNQNIIHFTSFINQTLQVIEKTENNIKLKWINPPENRFTLPSIIIFGSLDLANPNPTYDDVLKISPPFAIWENGTEIIESNDDFFVTKTTPTMTKNLTDNITQIPLDLLGGETLFVLPDSTSVTYNDTFITFHLDPEEGKIYKYAEQSIYGEINIELSINNVTTDKVNLSVFIAEYNQSQFYELDREISFNRTFEFPRIYDMDISFLQQALPQFEIDLLREGYSLGGLAGETLIFEISIEEIIKTSQKDS